MQDILIGELNQAKKSIKAAIAWFTNEHIFNAIINCLNKGIVVELIIRDDYINNSEASLPWIKIINANGRIYFSSNSHKLHHKYCIIDDVTIITGSYNWTYLAEKVNQENIVIIKEKNLTDSYLSNFKDLKKSSLLVTDFSQLNKRQIESSPLQEKNFIEEELKLVEENIVENTISIDNQAERLQSLLKDAEYSYLNKHYDEALRYLSLVLKIDDHQPLAYELLSWLMFRQNNYADQIKYAEKGVELFGDDPEYNNLLGIGYGMLKNQRQSLTNFDKSIKLLPENTTYYSNKITFLEIFGLHSLADKEILNLNKAASTVIKNKENYTPYNVMKAYIDRAMVKSGRTERKEAAIKAREYFYKISESERDYNDLDDIDFLMKS
ncbi:phospholipase D-like domain-containing protein [Adhaeribacter radiodurans]|uniref:phospholipase D-like domain-containing protein n=1 Tax=Adhaeribacter radiodurans TaxID=2745197 RepID=UPI0021D13FFF|nr:phospholipase D-like domain-containing protein [Adhaeribacter radiodurans]